MEKKATDQYHWDFERLFDRVSLVIESWEGAPHIDPERLAMAQHTFGQALTMLRMSIQDV